MKGIHLQQSGKKGHYRAFFHVHGKQICRATGTADKRAAMNRAKALKAAMESGAWDAVASVTSAKGQATVGGWCDAYLRLSNVNAASAKKNCNRLRQLYREALGVSSAAVDAVKLDALNRAQVDAWIGKRQGVASPCWREVREVNTTLNNILRLAKSMFTREAVRRICEELKTAPPRLDWKEIPKLKEPSHKYEVISDDVIQAIKKGAEDERKERPWMWMITKMVLSMGLRASEVLGARRDWVEDTGETLILHIRKREDFTPKSKNSTRSLEIPEELHGAVLSITDPQAFLMPGDSYTGRYNRIYRVHSEWLRQFLPDRTKSNHELRKHAGSLVAMRDGIEAAAHFLGDTIAVTEAHYHGLLSIIPALKPAEVSGFQPRVIQGKAI